MTEYKLNDDLIYGAGFSRYIPSGNDSYDYWQSIPLGIYHKPSWVTITNAPSTFALIIIMGAGSLATTNHGDKIIIWFDFGGGGQCYMRVCNSVGKLFPWVKFQTAPKS